MKKKRKSKAKKQKKRMGKNKKNTLNTKSWKMAEMKYLEFVSRNIVPFLNTPMNTQDRIICLNDIIKTCPEYYPALIDAGYGYIQMNMDEEGKTYIDKGLRSLKKYSSNKGLIEAYYNLCEFLEKYLRFELSLEYYNQLIDLEKDKASIYDYMSYCYVYLGDMDKALEYQRKALELDVKNYRYYCNIGWAEMICGNLEAAKIMLEKSLELNKEDEFTINNYKICKEMIASKKLNNWEDYLLREKDCKYLEELLNKEKMDEYLREIETYNLGRIEAFKFYLVQKQNYTCAEKYDILCSLKYVFDIIWKAFDDDFFSYDNIEMVEDYFKAIMHKVIFKTGDIDDKIFNGIYRGLLEFYKFLEIRKVVSDYESLEKEMLELKPELREKMLKYNEIRHNDKYTKEEKEEVCEELFEGDAFWPWI